MKTKKNDEKKNKVNNSKVYKEERINNLEGKEHDNTSNG